jgi:hypothetical protein
VVPYKENGRYINAWMAERPSVGSFFLSWFKDQVRVLATTEFFPLKLAMILILLSHLD